MDLETLDPIPIESIAYVSVAVCSFSFSVTKVLTNLFQIRCALEEYKTGTRIDKDFSEKRFRRYYNKLLRNLQAYQVSNRMPALRRFCSQIYRTGRYVKLFPTVLAELDFKFQQVAPQQSR